MSRALRLLDVVVGGFVAFLLGLSVVAVLWQVASRYLLADPSSFTDELVRYLLVWIGILGAAHAAGRRLHLAIDLLPDRLPPRRRHALGFVTQALVFLFAAGVLGVGGGHLVALTASLGQRSAALGVPLAAIYVVLPLAALLLMLYSGLFAAEHWRRARGLDPALELDPGGDPGPVD